MKYYLLDSAFTIPQKLSDYLQHHICPDWINFSFTDIKIAIQIKDETKYSNEISGYTERFCRILMYDDDGNFIKDVTSIYNLLI